MHCVIYSMALYSAWKTKLASNRVVHAMGGVILLSGTAFFVASDAKAPIIKSYDTTTNQITPANQKH